MNKTLRRSLGVMGIGASWGVVWGMVFTALDLIIGFFRPDDIGPGEGPLDVSRVGLLVGFVSGAIFGTILSILENRKSIRELSLLRVAIWASVAAAVWPLITVVDDSMVIILCPLGAGCALAAVTIARKAWAQDTKRSKLLSFIGGIVAKPLAAACASNG